MDFVSIEFYLFLAVILAAYYAVPLRFRWYVLLAGSLSFYYIATGSLKKTAFFIGIIFITWVFCLMLEKHRSRVLLLCAAAVSAIPLFMTKVSGSFPVILGLSFFTMQIIACMADIYRGKVTSQKNVLKYALFVSYFPQIIQGPIPRYDQLEPQLVEGHRFDDDGFAKGFMLIIWGFFLKFMIADKAGIVVDAVFGSYQAYQGAYVLVAGILYSIQLYADFLACVTLAQGISQLFGIRLSENFNHPYLASGIRDFWGRWHISLSTWLRDYVYIPLGGNRKGKARKYLNLCLTFAVSGFWHGSGIKYVLWGLMHAVYEVIGSLTGKVRDKAYSFLGMTGGRRSRLYSERIFTFILVMTAWILFRADTAAQGFFMIRSMFTVYNPWVLSNGALLTLGLGWGEWVLLGISVMILIFISTFQEKGVVVRDVIIRQPRIIRWGLYIAAISAVIIFGTYGYGFNAADFIYGGF